MRRLLLPIAIVLVGCTPTSAKDMSSMRQVSDKPIFEEAVLTSENVLPIGSFVLEKDGFASGTTYVEGYLKTSLIAEPYCIGSCRFYRYAWLEVLRSSNPDLREFLRSQQGAAADRDSIGLGCLEKKDLIYINDSDDLQRKEFLAHADISAALFASSAQRPIHLVLTKHHLSRSSEPPPCYSHFTEVALWNSHVSETGL